MASSLYKANATSFLDSCAASTNATSATSAATEIYAITAYNAAASVRYVKFYNKSTAPTIGTDVPVLVLAIPPATFGRIEFAKGLYFSSGIGYGIVTGAATSNTTAPSAADVTALTISYAL